MSSDLISSLYESACQQLPASFSNNKWCSAVKQWSDQDESPYLLVLGTQKARIDPMPSGAAQIIAPVAETVFSHRLTAYISLNCIVKTMHGCHHVSLCLL